MTALFFVALFIAGVVSQSLEADLSVNKSAPIYVTTGSTFDYQCFIYNYGPRPATNPRVIDEIPDALIIKSYSTYFVNGTVTCTLSGHVLNCTSQQPLKSGDYFLITVTVQAPSTPQTILNTAVVSSITPDYHPFNNRGSVFTQVLLATTTSTTTVTTTTTTPTTTTTTTTTPTTTTTTTPKTTTTSTTTTTPTTTTTTTPTTTTTTTPTTTTTATTTTQRVVDIPLGPCGTIGDRVPQPEHDCQCSGTLVVTGPCTTTTTTTPTTTTTTTTPTTTTTTTTPTTTTTTTTPTTTTSTTTTTTTTAAPTTAAPNATCPTTTCCNIPIIVGNNFFKPNIILARVGDNVTFVWDDIAGGHSVFQGRFNNSCATPTVSFFGDMTVYFPPHQFTIQITTAMRQAALASNGRLGVICGVHCPFMGAELFITVDSCTLG